MKLWQLAAFSPHNHSVWWTSIRPAKNHLNFLAKIKTVFFLLAEIFIQLGHIFLYHSSKTVTKKKATHKYSFTISPLTV